MDCDLSSVYNLTAVQFRAIELTLQGIHDTAIAQMLSISRRTLWHWKTHNPDYRRALADVRSQLHSGLSDRFRNLLLRSMSVLDRLLQDPSDNNRFRAAYAFLTMSACFKPQPVMLPEPTPPPVRPPPPPHLPYKMG